VILIVGLGNPGVQYINTRHNLGYLAVEMLSYKYDFVWSAKAKFNADIAVGFAYNQKIILCKPGTYMNSSGISVSALVSFYKLKVNNIIVIHDDIDLAPGKIKYKFNGSAAGHNGIRSINTMIGSNYQRIRVGIGRNDDNNISNFVLGKFTQNEENNIQITIKKILIHLPLIYTNDVEKFKQKICLINKNLD